jgi:hypothetical protein
MLTVPKQSDKPAASGRYAVGIYPNSRALFEIGWS